MSLKGIGEFEESLKSGEKLLELSRTFAGLTNHQKKAVAGTKEFSNAFSKAIDAGSDLEPLISFWDVLSDKQKKSIAGTDKFSDSLIKALNDGVDINPLISFWDALDDKQKQAVISNKNLSDSGKKAAKELADAATSAGASGVAAAGASGGVAGLGAAFAGAAASARTFVVALISNPITWIVGALAAVGAAAYMQATAFDRAKEKAVESQAEYQSTVSELSNLNSELTATKSRIEELQSLKDAGTITLAEESELTKLKAQNETATYERLALCCVSVFTLSHWRNEVTVKHYMI